MKRNLLIVLGASALVAGAVVGLASLTASAQGSGGSATSTIYMGASKTDVGTATLANNPSQGQVTVGITAGQGYTFVGGFICIGENDSSNNTSYFTYDKGFTNRVNPGGSTQDNVPGCQSQDLQYFVMQQFGRAPTWTVTGVPASFFTEGMYLQVHINVSYTGAWGQPSTGTAFPGYESSSSSCPCWCGNWFWGNWPNPVPLGTVGGLGAAVLVGGGLVGRQLKRERSLRRSSARAA
ncbi:MAG: hypothetical protein ACP5VR_09870 [Acidimicrobiales bacterium]